MTSLASIKKIFLVLFVLFVFLLIKQKIVGDSHNIGHLPLKACPVCAAAEKLFFSDHTFADVPIHSIDDVSSIQLPVLQTSLHSRFTRTFHNNRAPPGVAAS